MTNPTEPKATSPAMTEGHPECPTESGAFVGDIFFGLPDHSTYGTHRWDGVQWVPLRTDTDVLVELLAVARAERDAARKQLAPARAAVGGEPVGYFVYDEAWKAWHQVVDSAKGDDGVVALYATPSIPDAGSAGDVGHVAKMIRQWVAEGNSGSLIERSESLADAVLKALAARAGDQP